LQKIGKYNKKNSITKNKEQYSKTKSEMKKNVVCKDDESIVNNFLNNNTKRM